MVIETETTATATENRVYLRDRAARLSIEYFPGSEDERTVIKIETKGGSAPLVVRVDEELVVDRS